MKTKKCIKCNNIKQYKDFCTDNHLIDGHTSSCRICINTLRRTKYKEKNKNKIPKRKKKTKEELKKYRREWYSQNKHKIYRNKEYRNKYKKERKKRDPLFRMRLNISDYMRKIIKSKGYMKSKKMQDILGMSFDYYTKYLEDLFEEGMTWENWSFYGWHIDHIIPLCSARNEKELLKLLHYSNTRPLWSKDNLSKGGKLVKFKCGFHVIP